MGDSKGLSPLGRARRQDGDHDAGPSHISSSLVAIFLTFRQFFTPVHQLKLFR